MRWTLMQKCCITRVDIVVLIVRFLVIFGMQVTPYNLKYFAPHQTHFNLPFRSIFESMNYKIDLGLLNFEWRHSQYHTVILQFILWVTARQRTKSRNSVFDWINSNKEFLFNVRLASSLSRWSSALQKVCAECRALTDGPKSQFLEKILIWIG